MGRLKRIKRTFCIWIINSFLSGTHFFELKRLLLRAAGIPCGVGSKVVGPVYLGNVARVRIGSNVWVGTRFAVYGNGSVTLGDDIDIAPEVAFLTGSHEMVEGPLHTHTHRAGKGVSFHIEVGNGTWIGARSTIMGNTTIGDGCVIAVGAVVNRTVGTNMVVGGVPARSVRKV